MLKTNVSHQFSLLFWTLSGDNAYISYNISITYLSEFTTSNKSGQIIGKKPFQSYQRAGRSFMEFICPNYGININPFLANCRESFVIFLSGISSQKYTAHIFQSLQTEGTRLHHTLKKKGKGKEQACPNKKPAAKILHIFCNVYRQPNQTKKIMSYIWTSIFLFIHEILKENCFFVSVPQVNDIQIECKNTNTNRMQTCFSFFSWKKRQFLIHWIK